MHSQHHSDKQSIFSTGSPETAQTGDTQTRDGAGLLRAKSAEQEQGMIGLDKAQATGNKSLPHSHSQYQGM